MVNMKRRDFVKSVSAALAAAGAGTSVACGSTSTGASSTGKAVGIQLYTVRNLMSEDPARTLAALAEIGYREVELAGLNGKTAREFRAMLDTAGLTAPSSHIGIADLRSKLNATLDDAAVLGNQWIVVPWIDEAERTKTGFETIASDFNRIAGQVKQRGMGFAYHNHDFEFKQTDGLVPFDFLLERTDPSLVKYEVDLFWIRKGQRDPLEYFTRYPGRFPMVHVKDMKADGSMVNVGEGVIDFGGIFAQASQAGIQHYFVEHDNPTAPLDDVRVSYNTVHKLLGD
jgi:sugar phosphate isomerase/epimerase